MFRMKLGFSVNVFDGRWTESAARICREELEESRKFPVVLPTSRRCRVIVSGKRGRKKDMTPKYLGREIDLLSADAELLADLVVQSFMYLKEGNMEEARSMFESISLIELPLSQTGYGSLILGFAKRGDFEFAGVVLDEGLKRMGQETELYNAMLRAYSLTRDSKGIKAVYARMMENKVRPSGRTFYDMATVFTGRGQKEDVAWTLKEIQRVRIRKGKDLFKALLRIYAFEGDADNLELTAYEMGDSYGIKSDVETYNIRVNGLVNAGELDTAEEVIEEMKENMLKPDEYTFNNLLRGYVDMKDAEGVKKTFRLMKVHKARPNSLSMVPIMTLMSELGDYNDGKFYLREMRIAKLRIGAYAFNMMSSIFAQHGDMRSAIETVRRMQKEDAYPTKVTYSGLFRNYLDEDEQLMDHRLIFQDLEKVHGISEDLYLDSLLLDGYLKYGQLSLARSLMRTIARNGGEMKVVLYNVIIAYLCDSKRLDEVDQLVRKMRLLDLQLNYRTYAPQVRAYCLLKDHETVLRLLEEMRELLIFPRTSVRAALQGAAVGNPNFQALSVLRTELDAELIDQMKQMRLLPKKKIRKMLYLKREKDTKVWKIFEDHQLQYNRLIERKDGELYEVDRYRETKLFEFGERDEDVMAEKAIVDRMVEPNIPQLMDRGLIDQSTRHLFVEDEDDYNGEEDEDEEDEEEIEYRRSLAEQRKTAFPSTASGSPSGPPTRSPSPLASGQAQWEDEMDKEEMDEEDMEEGDFEDEESLREFETLEGTHETSRQIVTESVEGLDEDNEGISQEFLNVIKLIR